MSGSKSATIFQPDRPDPQTPASEASAKSTNEGQQGAPR
jgi:hypothetical protein